MTNHAHEKKCIKSIEFKESKESSRIIPASQRPDGSFRKERKIRPGFIRQEDVQLYQPPHRKNKDNDIIHLMKNMNITDNHLNTNCQNLIHKDKKSLSKIHLTGKDFPPLTMKEGEQKEKSTIKES